VVAWNSLDEQVVSGTTLRKALAWCLVRLMAKGIGRPKGRDWGYELGMKARVR
jgi:hypothetical protein